jgi:hypothetical protein
MTPLFKKLNLGDHKTILVLKVPESFEAELALLDGVSIQRKPRKKPSELFAIGFAITQLELDDVSTKFVNATTGDPIIWIAYPKGTSKKFQCEFNRDTGWSILNDAGFETVRIVAIDEDWSALRFRRSEYVKSSSRNA